MLVEKVSFADTHSFSSFFLDYIHQNDSLKPFYHRFPQLQNFSGQLKEKSSFPKSHRQILVTGLQKQYKDFRTTNLVKSNILSLASENTFTVTTGHQLNIFTGPLYFIYKIVTVINTCNQLKQKYPDYNFVPVYWLASEDHDFAEISYFNLYGKKYAWQTDQQGAVGRFDPKGLAGLISEVPGDMKIFKEAYLNHSTLSDAVRYYVNELFGPNGLVVIDGDDRSFKNLLKGVIQDDLSNQVAKRLVEECNAKLKEQGHQAQVNARDVNLFYLSKGIRNRIEKTEDGFCVVDSSLRFSYDQLLTMIREEPEKFSPNVILRPVYQEMILPNLAYVGGPAEIVYWLQLRSLFDHYQVPFPILMPRNFALVMDAPMRRKFEKTGLEGKDLFEEKNYLFNHWVIKNSHNDLTLGQSINRINEIFNEISLKTSRVDKTLDPVVGAAAKRVMNSLEKIERKLVRAEKRLHADKLRQIETLKDLLFPNGSLQERTDNFLRFYQQDPDFILQLIRTFDPFDFQFNLLSYCDKE